MLRNASVVVMASLISSCGHSPPQDRSRNVAYTVSFVTPSSAERGVLKTCSAEGEFLDSYEQEVVAAFKEDGDHVRLVRTDATSPAALRAERAETKDDLVLVVNVRSKSGFVVAYRHDKVEDFCVRTDPAARILWVDFVARIIG
jgi:hypothetical protein